MSDTFWTVLVAIVTGVLSGTISARITVSRIMTHNEYSPRTKIDQRARGGRDAKNVGGNETRWSGRGDG